MIWTEQILTNPADGRPWRARRGQPEPPVESGCQTVEWIEPVGPKPVPAAARTNDPGELLKLDGPLNRAEIEVLRQAALRAVQKGG
jgi:hypothetical protein